MFTQCTNLPSYLCHHALQVRQVWLDAVGPGAGLLDGGHGAFDVLQAAAGVDDDDPVVGADKSLLDSLDQAGIAGGAGRLGEDATAARQDRNRRQDLVGVALVLYRQVPRVKRFLAYIPEGPVLPWDALRAFITGYKSG